ncbi:hypothetical protein B0H19DRAFT_1274773 [Mycena capillaripes]|nr:hypothetical protein B0H19DRAFT_1274773 [Mycena capillaripes]
MDTSLRQERTRIDHGELIRWTKGFGAANTEGHGVAAMFLTSLAKFVADPRHHWHAHRVASHYVNPKTKIAVIFGTECDAEYMKRVADIPKIKNLGIDDEAEVGINCEWLFEHEHLPRTKYDAIVDDTFNKPGEQAFNVCPHQKPTPGRYLSEILRLVICVLIDEGVLFHWQNTYPYVFDTAFLSLMESDPTDELLIIIGIFTHFCRGDDACGAPVLPCAGAAYWLWDRGHCEQDGKYPGFADRVHDSVDCAGQVPASAAPAPIHTPNVFDRYTGERSGCLHPHSYTAHQHPCSDTAQSIGIAASFDKNLTSSVGCAIGSEACSISIHACFSPVLDLGKEPCWGTRRLVYVEAVELPAFAAHNSSQGGPNAAPFIGRGSHKDYQIANLHARSGLS